jgi:hypothetical protein
MRVTSSVPVTACMYFECKGGTGSEVACLDGATPDQHPGGPYGCCMTIEDGVDRTLEMDVSCFDADEDGTVYMTVEDGPQGMCHLYDLEYHF